MSDLQQEGIYNAIDVFLNGCHILRVRRSHGGRLQRKERRCNAVETVSSSGLKAVGTWSLYHNIYGYIMRRVN